MADTGILQSLWGMLQPREASAEVVGTPTSQRLLQDLQTQNAANKGQYLYDMYQRILRQAQAHPAEVGVFPWHGLIQKEGAVGVFEPEASRIRYEAGLSPPGLANVVPHELVHFLNAQTAKLPEAAQHALLKKLLGTDVYAPPEVLQGYQPGAFSPVEHAVINEWLGGPRDWPR